MDRIWWKFGVALGSSLLGWGSFAGDAFAFGRESPNISTALSAGYGGTEASVGRGSMVGAEFTYSTLLPDKDTSAWLTGGGRFLFADTVRPYAYTEAGIWFGLNIGLRYSLDLGHDPTSLHNARGFLGLPIPLYGVSTPRVPGFFAEPYYRPMLGLSDSVWSHEFGLLIGFTTLKFGSWSSMYD